MAFEVLEGALTTMKRCAPSKKLAESLNRPLAKDLLGHRDASKETDLARLRQLMEEDDELHVWEVFHTGDSTSFGYVMLVFYDGPPFIAVYPHSERAGPEEQEISRDILLHLIPMFFENSSEEMLYFYTAASVDQEIYDQLIDAGFDEDDGNPTINYATEKAFVMWRHTYDAYYGEGTDEEFGDVDDDGNY